MALTLPFIELECENTCMSFDFGGERTAVPGADDSSRGDDAARRAAEASHAGRSGGRNAVIAANDEELFIGGTDIDRARSALAELGAQGSRSLDGLSPQDTIALLVGLQKMSSAVAAVQARALVHLEAVVKEDSLHRGETPKQALKVARTEASAALKRSKAATGQTMSSCRRLVRSMPGMLAALAEGKIVAASCHQVSTVMGPATPEQRRQVDEILTEHLGHLEDCGPQEWGDEADKVLHTLDPDGAAARHQQAKRERSVTVRRGRHGMSTITAHVSGLDGARIRKGLSVAAEKARAGGDRRGHQQIMVDLFADALIGRGDGVDPTTLDIGVIITDRSLFAPAHADAAIIEGYGSVTYEHIRAEMQRAMVEDGDSDLALTLRRLYADADDGQLVAVESRAREFPKALARFIRFAHQTCRAPHCDANIRQTDHIVPWSQGGETSLANGNGLCAADNQKEESGQTVRVITDENGVRRTVEWTSRYGQTARRRGTNVDPVGTALRLRQREESARRAAERDEAAQIDTAQIDTAQFDAERSRDHAADEPGKSFHRAFARIDPERFAHLDVHPAAPLSRRAQNWLRRRRADYVVGRHQAVPSGGPPGADRT